MCGSQRFTCMCDKHENKRNLLHRYPTFLAIFLLITSSCSLSSSASDLAERSCC